MPILILKQSQGYQAYFIQEVAEKYLPGRHAEDPQQSVHFFPWANPLRYAEQLLLHLHLADILLAEYYGSGSVSV